MTNIINPTGTLWASTGNITTPVSHIQNRSFDIQFQGRQNGPSMDLVLLTLENMDLKIILNFMVLYSMIWSGGEENAIRVTFM